MDGDFDKDDALTEDAPQGAVSDDAELDDDLDEDEEDLDEENLASHGFHTEDEPADAGY